MTLNGVIVLVLRYFTEFDSFGADYVKVVKIDLYYLQNIVFHFWPKPTDFAAQSLR